MGIRSKANIPVTALALAVLGICSYLLYQDFFFLVYSNPNDAVGEITYRYRVAQRRGASSVVWENVEQGSKVFNRNFVRTDADSEAVVILEDKTVIELDPDSMVMLEVRPGEARVRFERGSILVRRAPSASSSRKKLVLVSDKEEIPVKDQALRVLRVGDQLKATPLNTSEELLRIPLDNHRVFSSGKRETIRFAWKPKGKVVFQLSRHSNFSKLELSRVARGGVDLHLEEGIYYWRIEVAGKACDFRKFRILRKPPLHLLAPAPGEKLVGKGRELLVPFAWSPHAFAGAYILEISNSADFSRILERRRVYRSRISLNLKHGAYFWRVRSVSELPGAEVQSSVRRLALGETRADAVVEVKGPEERKVEPPRKVQAPRKPRAPQKAVLPPQPALPRLISPRGTVDMTTRDYILFRWKKTPGALDYEFRLFRGSKLLYTKKTRSTRLRFSDLSKLDVGRFRWSIRARFPAKGAFETREKSQVFRIILKEAPGKPELE